MSLLTGLLFVLFADTCVVAGQHAAGPVGWLTFAAVIVAIPSALNGLRKNGRFRTKESDDTSADNSSANGVDAVPEKPKRVPSWQRLFGDADLPSWESAYSAAS